MAPRRMIRVLIWTLLAALATLPACATKEYVLADPEPTYDETSGYVRVVSPVRLLVEDGHGGIGELDATGLYLIHGRHLRALLKQPEPTTRPAIEPLH